MFESILDALHTNLKERDFRKIELPYEFTKYQNDDSNYCIRNWQFESSLYRKWRITKLDGGRKLQVLNTVAYPSFKREKPILGVDILWFGASQKLLAVLDCQPLIQNQIYLNQYCSSLEFIKQKYSHFDNKKMNNIYDSNKYFSPWVIICRGNKRNLEDDLCKVFRLFLDEYFKLDNIFQKNQFMEESQVKEKQIDYDKYSLEKDPADKLFKNFFGEMWTENFVNNFLFTLS